MAQVPTNLIPTRVTELPSPESYSSQGLLIYVQNGVSYKVSGQELMAALGPVSSVDVSGGTTGLTFSGGPITATGVITMAGTLDVDNGGTGATTAPGARANLQAAVLGTNNDITSLTAMTGGISTPDFVQLDIAAAASIALAKVRWNADVGTVSFGIIDGTQEVEVGQQMYARVTNAEAAPITRGQAVYLYQATGNRASVKLAANTGDSTSAKTLGLVVETISAGGTGFVITQGVLDKVDTSAFAEGATLYLGATAGSLTSTKPQAPNHLVYIGVVERANAGNGQIYVRPQNGYELDEIHDVRITSVQNNDLLQYYSAGPYWRNIAPGSVSVGTATNLANGAAGSVPYQSGAGATSLLAIGASTYILTSSGSAPQWSAPSGLTVGTATDATNAANTAITDDTSTSATVYPSWVTANTGNLPQKVSSTKLKFNPSTGVLTATGGIGGGVF